MTVFDYMRLVRDQDNPFIRHGRILRGARGRARFAAVLLVANGLVAGAAVVGAGIADYSSSIYQPWPVLILLIAAFVSVVAPVLCLMCFAPRALDAPRLEELRLTLLTKDEVVVGVTHVAMKVSFLLFLPWLVASYFAAMWLYTAHREPDFFVSLAGIVSLLSIQMMARALALRRWLHTPESFFKLFATFLLQLISNLAIAITVILFLLLLLARLSRSISGDFAAEGMFEVRIGVTVLVAGPLLGLLMTHLCVRAAGERFFASIEPEDYCRASWLANEVRRRDGDPAQRAVHQRYLREHWWKLAKAAGIAAAAMIVVTLLAMACAALLPVRPNKVLLQVQRSQDRYQLITRKVGESPDLVQEARSLVLRGLTASPLYLVSVCLLLPLFFISALAMQYPDRRIPFVRGSVLGTLWHFIPVMALVLVFGYRTFRRELPWGATWLGLVSLPGGIAILGTMLMVILSIVPKSGRHFYVGLWGSAAVLVLVSYFSYRYFDASMAVQSSVFETYLIPGFVTLGLFAWLAGIDLLAQRLHRLELADGPRLTITTDLLPPQVGL